MQITQSDARARGHRAARYTQIGQTLATQDHIAGRRRAARKRRLRADGKDTICVLHDPCDLRDITWACHSDRVAAGIVRGVLEIPCENVRICFERNRSR